MTWGNRVNPWTAIGLPEGEAVGVHVGEVHSVELHLVGGLGDFWDVAMVIHLKNPENTTTYPLVNIQKAIENGDL